MNRLGEVNCNSKGERFAIKTYNSSQDVEVVFESDNSVKNVTYAQFRNGHVRKGVANSAVDWVGESVEDRYGEECKIVEYNSDNAITVQYKDGDVISGLTLDEITTGNFDHRPASGKRIMTEAENNIDILRRQTYEAAIAMLSTYRRCVMIRPCSFGKTKIGLKLFSSPRYQRCLFLYPTEADANAEIIRNSHSQKIIDTRTYTWLRTRTMEQIEKLDYDIVFCDEVHCIGGDDDGSGAFHTYKAVSYLMKTHPKTHFIGATATPLRMDGINVVSTMFHNHVVFPYTTEDAFEDGLLKAPYYYYCIYDVLKKVRDSLGDIKSHITMDRDELQSLLKLNESDLNEIDTRYMDKHIKDVCDKVIKDQSYMRFIAFYLTNEDIDNNKGKVLGWFKKAFPEHELSFLVVTNKSGKTARDIDKLPTAPTDPKYKGRIDIIFNCEVLCTGYHSEHITGLIIDRKTKSFTKYIQMIGRLLSFDDDKPVVIFDVVDNIHADFICKMNPVEAAPVVAEFKNDPKTFAEITKMYPHARHWDRISVQTKKAKRSELLLLQNQALNKNNTQPPVDITCSPVYDKEAEVISEDVKEAINKAWEVVEKNNMSFTEAADYLAGIENKYGTINPYEEVAASSTQNDIVRKQEYKNPYKDERSVSLTSEFPDIDIESDIQVGSEVSKAETQLEAEQGYSSTYYYDYETNAMYNKYIKGLNKRSNFAEEIKEAATKISKQVLDDIIKRWHDFDVTDYTSYDEVDKKSKPYIILKSLSEFKHNCPVEAVLAYMIEGKIINLIY